MARRRAGHDSAGPGSVRTTRHSSTAFTLVEMLVVIAIIGVLVGMALPAMQGMRELARRSTCQQRLAGLSLGLSAHASRHLAYPAGTLNDSGPIRSRPAGYHHNWIGEILPFLDAVNVQNVIDKSVGVYAPENRQALNLRLPMLNCPSASHVAENTTCYAGSSSSTETPIDVDNDGVFFLNSRIRDSDVTDGLAYTLFLGEKLSPNVGDLGWLSGTRSSLRTTGLGINEEKKFRLNVDAPSNPRSNDLYVGGFASEHPGGGHVLLGDGSIRFRSDSGDLRAFQQLASRADGAIPEAWKTDPTLPTSDKSKTIPERPMTDTRPDSEKAESPTAPVSKPEEKQPSGSKDSGSNSTEADQAQSREESTSPSADKNPSEAADEAPVAE